MTTEVKMPRLSETMLDGKILSWNKKEGDIVNKGEILAEVETDKANMEVEALDSGIMSKILVPVGHLAKVGDAIAILNGKSQEASEDENKNEPPREDSEEHPKEEQKTEPTQEIKQEEKQEQEIPQQEHQIKKKEKQTPAIPETSSQNKEEHQITEEEKQESEEPEELEKQSAKEDPPFLKASPLARKIAREKNINISKIKGTGPGGRIQEKDVMNYFNSGMSEEIEKESSQAKINKTEGGIIRPLSKMRKTIADRMTYSKLNIPHFYVTIEASVDKLLNLQKKYQENNKIHVTFNDMFIKIVAIALVKNPIFNSEFKGNSIEFKENINIGIAFALKDGLLLPVVHDCDKKNLLEITNETQILKNKVKNNKLKPEDLSGATFSISNMGMYGVKEFSVIINPPEAAGLAIGSINKMPVFNNNKILISNIASFTVSADHRVVNGAEAAIFLNTIKEVIENIDTIEKINLSN